MGFLAAGIALPIPETYRDGDGYSILGKNGCSENKRMGEGRLKNLGDILGSVNSGEVKVARQEESTMGGRGEEWEEDLG